MESIEDLIEQQFHAESWLDEAAHRWIETKSSGRSTASIEAEISAVENTLHDINRKIATVERRSARRKDTA